MKRMKRSGASILCLLLCAALLLAACGGGTVDNTEPKEATYRVTVKDALGTPYSAGVIVRFLRDGEQAAMQVVDENGVAEKTLEKGDYTVELMFTDDAADYYYDQTELTLSADKTELEVILAHTVNLAAVSLYAQSEERLAYHVGEGCTYVNLTAGERSYFLFTPTRAGTYEFSTVEAVEGIGYFGSPHFVQDQNIGDVTEKGVSISISADMIGTDETGTAVLVLGIDGGSAENCVLTVQRIGDPERTLADEPWTVYKTTAQLAPYKVDPNAKLKDFDLTASSDKYCLVYNATDGFYHLDSSDGPLVLTYLAEPTRYLDSFQFMLENGNVCKFFFDEEGNFIKKENYNECLMEYMEYVDEDYGVYPLTEDLMYIIAQRSEYTGWWDRNSQTYMLVDNAGNPIPDINPDIAWLSLCCYVEIG